VNRIQKAYAAKFRATLRRFGARRVEEGVRWWLARARWMSATRALPFNEALTLCDTQLHARRARGKSATAGRTNGDPAGPPPCFLCDAGLGGLTRWLRAVGYQAEWRPHADDAALLQEARARRATLVTTDSLLLERRIVREGLLPTIWLPPTRSAPEQLALLLRELRLPVRPPRCMSCGGELRAVPKAAVADRIPPRTARWLDEYFVCAHCDRLFWRGTHWQRIQARLQQLGVG